MFVTPEEVMAVTPYENITVDEVKQAQFVLELFVGRNESEIDMPGDVNKIRRAVIAQTVYMRDRPDLTFNQMSLSSISRGDGLLVFRSGDFSSPFIAPLAMMALSGLSWRRTRSVKVGRIHQLKHRTPWRND